MELDSMMSVISFRSQVPHIDCKKSEPIHDRHIDVHKDQYFFLQIRIFKATPMLARPLKIQWFWG